MKRHLFLIFMAIVLVEIGYAQNRPRYEQLKPIEVTSLSSTGVANGLIPVANGSNAVAWKLLTDLPAASGVLPVANGGTGSASQNFVDLTNSQSVAGAKTWSNLGTFSVGLTSSGKITTAASTTGTAGLILPHGAAPTSPVNGDVWTTSTAMYARINGTTEQLSTVSLGTSTYLPLAGGTMTGKLNTFASASGGAGLKIPPGTAPTSPVDGDFWSTSSAMYARINGTTEQLATVSLGASTYLPLAGGTMTGKLNTLASASGGAGLTLPHGVTPTAPVNGDIWTTTTGLFARINGSTVSLGSGNGTVTSVGGAGTVSGLTLSGTVTTSGNLTLGGTLAVAASNFASQTAKTFLAAPNAADGVPTFRAIVASDIPTLNQNTTGTAASITGTYSGSITSGQITTGLGFTPYNATNPNNYISLTALSSTATGLTYTNTTGVFSLTSGYYIPTTTDQTNWNKYNQWDGGSTGINAVTGRTSLGATTVGGNLFTLTNPGAITFLQINANNTVSALDAAAFRTAIGVGTGNGTVTSVAAGNGMDFTTITNTGSVTLGTPGTLTDATTNGVTTTSHTHTITTVLPSSASSGIMKASGTKTSGGFYGGTTAPDGTARLNYDGYLYATQLYDGANRVYSAGNANIGSGATNYSAGNHSHTGLLPSFTVSDANKLLKINSGGTATEWSATVPVNASGDVTIDESGVLTIGSDKVTSAKILDLTIATADIANNAVDGTKINLTSNVVGDMMYYNGTDWARLAAGTANYILKANGAAAPTWSSGTSLFSFSNGLTESSGAVKLGGTLTADTEINVGASTYNFFINASSGTNGGVKTLLGANTNYFIQNAGGDVFSIVGSTGVGKFTRGLDVMGGILIGTGTRIDNCLVIGSPTIDGSAMANGDMGVAGNAEIDGDLRVDGTFSSPSDERLKTKIQTLSGVLTRIDQLRGVTYEYKDQKKYATGPQIGVIAQELQKVFPELVSQGSSGYLAVDYTHLTGVLVQAIKEQQQQINDLQTKVADQERRLNAQQKQIDEIIRSLQK